MTGKQQESTTRAPPPQPEPATSLEEDGASTGRLIVVRGFDVASEESIRVLGARVEEVVRVTGARVHALINNAGVLVLARLEARLLGGGGGLCRLGEAGALLGLEVGDGA